MCIKVRCVRKKNTAAEAVVEKKKKNIPKKEMKTTYFLDGQFSQLNNNDLHGIHYQRLPIQLNLCLIIDFWKNMRLFLSENQK